MKKLVLLALVCLAAFNSFAQGTTLSIQTENRERFWLYINDMQQNQYPVESIRVSNLAPDWNHKIRIVIDNRKKNDMVSEIRLQHGSNNFSVRLSKNGQISFFPINYNINAATQVMFQSPQDNHGHYPPQGNHNNHGNYPPQGNHGNYPPQGNHGNYPPQGNHGNYPPQGNHGHYPPQDNHNNQPQVIIIETTQDPEPQPVVMPCSDIDFADAKRTIANADFEDTKLTLAKQIVRSELMTARQLAEIAQLFDFEQSKLEFLKYAYPYCFDQNKYYVVNNVFEFSSSVDELNKYINQ